MSIVDGKGLVTWEGGLFEPGSDLLRRVQWAFGRIRADGGHIVLNEAGRPFGVPGDMNVRNSSQTASGLSTVWFQWGRYKRGETPSSANPTAGELASEHTQGIAIDCDAQDVYTATLRAKYFPQVGLKNTIASESWHWAIRGPALVNLGTTSAGSSSTPITAQEEEDDMGTMYQADDKLPSGVLAVAGRHYLQEDNGIFRHLSDQQARDWMKAHPVAYAHRVIYEAKDLDAEFYRTGIYEWTGDRDKPLALTGKVIGRSADVNNQNGSDNRHWPRVEPGSDPAPVR